MVRWRFKRVAGLVILDCNQVCIGCVGRGVVEVVSMVELVVWEWCDVSWGQVHHHVCVLCHHLRVVGIWAMLGLMR